MSSAFSDVPRKLNVAPFSEVFALVFNGFLEGVKFSIAFQME
jgi:hypothetical protein